MPNIEHIVDKLDEANKELEKIFGPLTKAAGLLRRAGYSQSAYLIDEAMLKAHQTQDTIRRDCIKLRK